MCLYRPFSNRKLNANQQRNAAICFTMMSGSFFFSWETNAAPPVPVWFTVRRWPLPSFYHHILGGGVVLLLTSFAWFVRPHIAKRPRVLKITICQQQKYNHYKYWHTWGKCGGSHNFGDSVVSIFPNQVLNVFLRFSFLNTQLQRELESSETSNRVLKGRSKLLRHSQPEAVLIELSGKS